MSSKRRGNVESKIAARFNHSSSKRKNITFNIDEELLERLDVVTATFNNNDGNTTRNAIIEDAVLGYVETAEDFFEQQNVNLDVEGVNNTEFDTAVYPATNQNFTKVFIGENKWYYVRMAEYRTDKVKYIALYRGAPTSAITHYAEVVHIGETNADNKRLITLKEPAPLPNQVSLGNIHVNNIRKLFYTSLNRLKNVKTVEELLKL